MKYYIAKPQKDPVSEYLLAEIYQKDADALIVKNVSLAEMVIFQKNWYHDAKCLDLHRALWHDKGKSVSYGYEYETYARLVGLPDFPVECYKDTPGDIHFFPVLKQVTRVDLEKTKPPVIFEEIVLD